MKLALSVCETTFRRLHPVDVYGTESSIFLSLKPTKTNVHWLNHHILNYTTPQGNVGLIAPPHSLD